MLELLIVIGILAILATTAVLVLNPAELLRQARDSQRISDLSTINSALALFVTSVSSPDLDSGGGRCKGDTGTFTCFMDQNIESGGVTCNGRYSSLASSTPNDTNRRTIAGSGWVPVNFSSLPGGSPLAVLPVDPATSTARFYSYACDVTGGVLTWELNAVFESAKYLTADDFDGKDGGSSSTAYEIGTDPGLDL